MNGPHFAGQPAPASAPTTPLAPPRAPRPASKPADRAKADPAAGGMMVLTYLRLHWMMILFCGTLLGAGLAYAAWNLLPSKFESYALLQVASTPSAIAEQGDPNRGKTAFATYIKTAAQVIKSELVLNSALNDPKYRIAELPTLKEQKDPIKYLDEKLLVAYSDGSEVIRVSLEGDRPDDIRKIVDAVTDAYYREVVEKEIKQKRALMLKVEEAKTALEGWMKKRSPSFVASAPPAPANGSPAPVVSPAAPQLPDAQGIVDPQVRPAAAVVPVPGAAVGAAFANSDVIQRAMFPILVQKVTHLKDELDSFPAQVKDKEAQVASLEKQIEALRHGQPSPEALEAADKDPDVLRARDIAAKLYRDYNNIRSVAQDPNSKEVLRWKIEADKAEAEANRLRDKKAIAAETARRQPLADKLYPQLDAAQRELRSLQERAQLAKVKLEKAQKELSEIPPEPKKFEEKGPLVDPAITDLRTEDGMYAALARQRMYLDFELQSPPRVRQLQAASNPTVKDTKKQILATVFAGLMGFGLIGLGAVAYETRVRKVSSLAELRASGPAAVAGVIPWTPDGTAARDPVKRADVNEAIDKLRAYVAQTWLARGATTVAVTSPLGDEGKAFTAFGLASSLAQAGYKTLLVDFDLRNPSLHPFAGVPNATGVCELLRGEADARSAVVALPNGLTFLPAGKWSDEARQAAVGGRLESLLARLREPFDCVVLHGHALLTVAESVEIARRSEVVLLCTLYRETRLPLLKRAAERLTAMEVPYSGVVYLGATANEALC